MSNRSYPTDLPAFYASLGAEVLAKKDRVRNLIGGAHWPSDGAWMERLVREAVRSMVPTSLEVGHGFLLEPTDHGREVTPSGQLDLLVYDASKRAPEFRDGEFACVLAANARIVGEVKANWDSAALKAAVTQVASATLMVRRHSLWDSSPESTFSSVLIGLSQERHRSNDGSLNARGRRAAAREFKRGYATLYPDGLGDSVADKVDFPGHYGWPTVAASLSGVVWTAMGETRLAEQDGRTLRVPVIQFYNPVVGEGSKGHNLVFQHALAIVRYKLDPVGKPLSTAQRQALEMDYQTDFPRLGPPVCLLDETEELREAFGENVLFLEP